MYREEIENSQKCKDFEKFLKSDLDEVNKSCDFFADASCKELEYFAVIFIKFAIENPDQVKALGFVASNFKTALLRIRKLLTDVVSSLKQEFEVTKQEKSINLLKIEKFSKLLRELYVSQGQLVPPDFMAEFLTFLNEKKQFIILTSTLKFCGCFYKERNRKHFESLIKSFAFGPIVENEIAEMSENFYNKDQILKSKLFKSSESALNIGNLRVVLSGIVDNRDVRFDYELYEMLHINTRAITNIILNIVDNPNANVIEVAKFLKSLNDFTYKIGNFIQRLKDNLKLKVLNMSTDSLQEMKTVGKILAELKNLSVTNNENQILWLEKVERLAPVVNFEVMEVYVDVVKAMLVNIQIHDYEKLHQIHKYLKDTSKSLEPSNTEVATRIKSKIAQILQNIILKKVDRASSELLFKIRLGHQIEGLPKDMPENSEKIFDVQDFAQLFYLNAIYNQYFTANYADAINILRTGTKGELFIRSLRAVLFFNLFPNTFAPECELDEVPGTFEFIALLFEAQILTDLEVISFLNKILELVNLEKYKDYLRIFIVELDFIVEYEKKTNRKFNRDLTNCIAKVRKMLKGPKNKKVTKNQPTVLKKTPKAPKNKKSAKKSTKATQKLTQNLPIQQNYTPTSTKTAPSDQSSSCYIPEYQRTQTSWSQIHHLLKNVHLNSEDSDSDSFLYDELYTEKSIKAPKISSNGSRTFKTKLDFGEIIQQSNKDKISLPLISLVPSTSQTNPELFKFYNEILPIITKNTSQFKKCVILIYNWKIDDSGIESQVKELILLLSKKLQKNHKQLLRDICKELTNECEIVRAGQGAGKKRKEYLQQKSSIILTTRAVMLFLEKRQVYDILHFMLKYIKDGNTIVFEMFLDITEGMEDVFIVDWKERGRFVTSCIDVLEFAAKFKDVDEQTLKKAIKMTKFLKKHQK